MGSISSAVYCPQSMPPCRLLSTEHTKSRHHVRVPKNLFRAIKKQPTRTWCGVQHKYNNLFKITIYYVENGSYETWRPTAVSYASRRARLREQSGTTAFCRQTYLRSTPSEPIAKPLSPPKNLTSYRLAPMLVAPALNLNVSPPSVEYHRLPPPPTAHASLSFWMEGHASAVTQGAERTSYN